MVGLSGIEPLTSRLSGVRSYHLSYRPACAVGRLPLVTIRVAVVMGNDGNDVERPVHEVAPTVLTSEEESTPF